MDVLRAADEANRGHAEAALVKPLARRGHHFGMIGEAEVVVGAQVDQLAPVHLDLRILLRSDEAFVLGQVLRLDLVEFGLDMGLEVSVHTSLSIPS